MKISIHGQVAKGMVGHGTRNSGAERGLKKGDISEKRGGSKKERREL